MNRTNWFGTFQIRLHSFALAVEIQSGKVYNHTDQGYTEFQSSCSRCSLHALSFTTITKQVATVLVAISQIPSNPLQITLSMSTTNTLGMPKYVPKSAPSHGGDPGSHQIHSSLGSYKSTHQREWQSVQPFLQGSCLIVTKLFLPVGESGSPPNT